MIVALLVGGLAENDIVVANGIAQLAHAELHNAGELKEENKSQKKEGEKIECNNGRS